MVYQRYVRIKVAIRSAIIRRRYRKAKRMVDEAAKFFNDYNTTNF